MLTLDTLLQNAQVAAIAKEMAASKDLLFEALWDCPKAVLLALAQKITGKDLLILTGGSRESRLLDDLPFFTNARVLEFPAWETLPSENISPSPDIVGQRLNALKQLTDDNAPAIVVCPLQSALQRLLDKAAVKQLTLQLKAGQALTLDQLIKQLNAMGYERRPVAVDKGEYALRGGICDVYPVSCAEPYRIEIWDDQIESLRTYDPSSQKSVQKVLESDVISPAKEMQLLQKAEKTASLLDYLRKDALVVFDDLLALEDRYVSFKNLASSPMRHLMSFEEFLKEAKTHQKIYVTPQRLEELSDVRALEKVTKNVYSDNAPPVAISFSAFGQALQANRLSHPFWPLSRYLTDEADEEISGQELLHALQQWSNSSLQLHVLTATESEEGHLAQLLQEGQIQLPKNTEFHKNCYLSSGFALKEPSLACLPMTEISHRQKLRRQKLRASYHVATSETLELQPGDLVVHLSHGIGKYIGIERRPNHHNIPTEFLILEYEGGSRLFVPASQSYLLTKYVGSHEEIPKLHQLGSGRWKRLRTQTEKALVGYAKNLIQLYATRKYKTGFSYPQDSQEMLQFEQEFPYEETEDQKTAIAEIKHDLESEKVMDRLLCGDVGYGKTEVAMRAAFKAVVDGRKQVAILVPTTVLALQHYETFIDRMSNFPVRIASLTRFCTVKEAKKILKEVEEGSLDILIGTHRLLSKDIHFKDLGLIIIDEEQRFGVKAKEHLKTLKEGVDCLALSATPIPRTLYMSLVGARDMSVIATPPYDRQPIVTLIAEDEDSVLKQAMQRELARDGQIFIIHNRVDTLFDIAERAKRLMPGIRLLTAHGQMSADEIEAIFHSFKKGHADVLVATTIVENGLDIPNANTILIDRADQYGLADLYQLRGRVGRWNRRAYAYFLLPKRRILSEVSKKRMDALAKASGYGGGMRIALRDLEIRGAGDLLGLEQSGHISGIGFHLYCKLLKRAIDALQGKTVAPLVEVKLEFPQDARLPEDYVNETALRLEIYQRLGSATEEAEVDALFDEIVDRFGKPPEQVQWLICFSRLRLFAARHNFTLLKLQKTTLLAERVHQGKTSSHTLLLQIGKTPEDFEKNVLNCIKKIII